MYNYGSLRGGNAPPPNPEDLYDLLTAIVRRTPWASEAEVKRYTELVTKIRRVNLFGYMATTITTESGDDE